MSDQRIRSVLIVGGGTAGWMAAAYLNRALAADVQITVLESPVVGRIGVGEATIPTLRDTLRFIGVEERDWMRACGATFKSSIKYKNWRVGPNAGVEDEFHHPFFPRPEPLIHPYGVSHSQIPGDGFTSVHYWMKRVATGRKGGFDRLVSPNPALCDERRFEATPEDRYAYHMDAALLAEFLRKLATGRGVRHVQDHMTDAKLDDRGFIESVKTSSGAVLEAELFLDCTGFRSLLLGKALGEPFQNENECLPNDRAVALSAQNHAETRGIPPYTLAYAMKSGWSWHIPLFHRFGTGYVYSTNFLTPDQAEREMRELLGPDCDEKEVANHIQIRVGRTRRQWVKNCVGVGLAGMFIEPLESTGIFMSEFQISSLVSCFPDRTFAPALTRRYNALMDDVYEQIRDFVVMHYVTTSREDTPYWRFIRHELKVPDSLATALEAWKSGLPPTDYRHFAIFRTNSWAAILSGMQVYPETCSPILMHADDTAADARFARVAAETKRLLEVTPKHYDFIRSLQT